MPLAPLPHRSAPRTIARDASRAACTRGSDAHAGVIGAFRRSLARYAPFRKPFARLATLGALAIFAGGKPASAAGWLEPGDQLRVLYGPSAYHFTPDEEHVDYNHLVAAELLTRRWTLWGANRSIVGLALLDNSFGQFSQYLYVGQEWILTRFAGGEVFGNVTAGLLHGYKPPYEDKIPFNQLGVAPAIVPSLGWRSGRFSALISLLGTNGVMATIGWDFDLKK